MAVKATVSSCRGAIYDLKSRNAILGRLEGLGYQLLIWYGIAF